MYVGCDQARPLLEGGHMTQHTPELRVKATVEGGIVSLADFVVQGESELPDMSCCDPMPRGTLLFLRLWP